MWVFFDRRADFRKSCCCTSSLCTLFETSPVLVPSLPVHNINNSSSRCNTANSHSMHTRNCIRQPQPPELAPRSSLQPSFPNHPTDKGFSRRKINNSYLPRVRNRTCKLLLPDTPRLASLFTIFEDTPVLVFPPPIRHELPEKQPTYSAQAFALASNKKVLSPNSNRKEKKYGDPQRNARIVDYHWKSIVKLANIQSCCSLQLTEWLIGDSWLYIKGSNMTWTLCLFVLQCSSRCSKCDYN